MKTIRAYLLGLFECRGSCGMTYDDDPESARSPAYDAGRNLGRRILRLDSDDEYEVQYEEE